SVEPPWIQCTTWWAALHLAGRSQLGQRQCRSRASRALRPGPETTRRERPTSITCDSEPKRIRVRAPSQASLSTVVEETGNEESISAAGAPLRPRSVSRLLVTVS